MNWRKGATGAESAEPLKGFDDYEVRLGDVMRGERATMGKSLLDVQRDLKIKATYIAAIENCDPTAFESQGFIAGYVRSYARYLGLDADWAFRTFCEESGYTGGQGIGSAPAPQKKSKKGQTPHRPTGVRDPLAEPSVSYVPRGEPAFSGVEPRAIGSIAVLIALISAIGYGGWAVLQEVQKVQFVPVDQAPGQVASLDPLQPAAIATDDPAEDIAAIAPVTESFDRLYRPQALDVPVLVARDGPIATIDPRAVGALAAPPVRLGDQATASGPSLLPSEPPMPGAVPQPGEPTVQVVAAEPQGVTLFAVRPSWVRVRAADGTVIFEKILDAGEKFDIPTTEEPAVLRAGNAGSVYFLVGDDAYGPAGEGPAVVKDVALSVDAVMGRFTVADLDRDADLKRFVAVAEATAAGN